MRALTYHGPKDVRVQEVADPLLPDSFGAVVRVGAAGICGSDLHIYAGHGFSDDLGYALGHEAVGEVVQTGADVHRFSVGDRVLVPASTGCLWCAECARGHVSGCENRRRPWKDSGYGMSHRLPGSQAEALAVPHADVNLVARPEGIDDDVALLLTDNLPTAWYGCRRAGIRPGDTVAVIGLGAVGQLAVQSALVMGAARVLAVDPVTERRRRAVELGAEAVDPADPRADLVRLAGRDGIDAVVEAVGVDASIGLALSAVRHGGRVSVIGVSQNQAFPFRMAAAQVKELVFAIGLCSAQAEMPALLPLARAGRFRSVVTHRLPLSEAPLGFAMLSERAEGVGKIVLDPSS